MARLIVTNGDSAIERLRAAGITDEILSWADMLHDGPVRAGLSLEDLSAERARFLAGDLELPHDKVSADFLRRDALIRAHRDFDRVELWFEHDLYDQLQLIQLLDFFASEGRHEGMALMQACDYLGLQSEGSIRGLAGTAQPITARQFSLAQRAWAVFRAPTPTPLARLATETGNDLPYLSAALRRLLAEMPAPGNGLSQTEERALAALASGPQSAGTLFKTVLERETARFLGDAPFFRRLDGLCFAPHPLIAGLPYPARKCAAQGRGYLDIAQAEIAITDEGRAALAGRIDHARANGIDRWIGGTHIDASSLWRWDRKTERLIDP